MGHKKNQEKAELSIYQQALKVARAKGGEARRNVARLSGDIRSFDRPDILITAEGGNRIKWLRTSGITAGIPVAAPLHHMDERLMHPEDRGTRWRRVTQAD